MLKTIEIDLKLISITHRGPKRNTCMSICLVPVEHQAITWANGDQVYSVNRSPTLLTKWSIGAQEKEHIPVKFKPKCKIFHKNALENVCGMSGIFSGLNVLNHVQCVTKQFGTRMLINTVCQEQQHENINKAAKIHLGTGIYKTYTIYFWDFAPVWSTKVFWYKKIYIQWRNTMYLTHWPLCSVVN